MVMVVFLAHCSNGSRSDKIADEHRSLNVTAALSTGPAKHLVALAFRSWITGSANRDTHW